MLVGVTNSVISRRHILSGQVPAEVGRKIPDERSSRVNTKEPVITLVRVPVISCTKDHKHHTETQKFRHQFKGIPVEKSPVY